MGSVDPTVGMAVIIVLMAISSIVLNAIRTWHSLKPRPSNETSLGTIAARIKSIEHELDATKIRLAAHEDKISRQIGALHDRINGVFGELQRIAGMMEMHLKKEGQ